MSPRNRRLDSPKRLSTYSPPPEHRQTSTSTKWHEALKTARPALHRTFAGQCRPQPCVSRRSERQPYTGAQADLAPIQIQQATTERAGAMPRPTGRRPKRRAARRGRHQETDTDHKLPARRRHRRQTSIKPRKSPVQVINGSLHYSGAQTLTAAGYVPYLFRRVGASATPIRTSSPPPSNAAARPYCPRQESWGL